MINSVHKPFRREDISYLQFRITIAYLLWVIIYGYISGTSISRLCVSSIMATVFVFGGVRVLWFVTEIVQYRNLYKLQDLLSDLMPTSNNCSCIIIIAFMFFLLMVNGELRLEVFRKTPVDPVILLSTVVIGIYLQWQNCPLLESYKLEESLSFSGGSGMAYGFYYGYLKLITPGLVKRIENFRDNEGIKDEQIPEKKLFILVPSSSYIFDRLQSSKRKDMTMQPVPEKVSPHIQDRGLVKNRVYKNTITNVTYGKNGKFESYYVLLEGATPLKTFYETCSEQGAFKKYKREVISSFYYTLRQLISDDPEMRNVIKLIYYHDEKKSSNVEIEDIVEERILKRKPKGRK